MDVDWEGFMLTKGLFVLVAAVMVGSVGVAQADVPKSEDMAVCNREAQEAVGAGSASRKGVTPNTNDATRATQARRGDAATNRAGSTTRHDDPQLDGMDAEGAKNPVYQAAYRTCMRKSGF
jgi:hypothetical protein